MSKGNTTEADIIAFVFNATAMPAYGSNLVVSLHTADPGEAGTLATNECDYDDYARVSVSRDSGGWTCTGNQAVNTAEVTWPECDTAFVGTQIATHGAVGTVGGQILYSGALTQSITIAALITPRAPAGTLVFTED